MRRPRLHGFDREGIYPEGLEGMGQELGLLGTESDEVIVFLERRQRVLHDLYHLLTGYDRDTAGEVALLRFSAIQEKNKALDFVSRIGQITFRDAPAFRSVQAAKGCR